MHITKYQTADCKQITQLFYDTVHAVNSKDYSKAQLDVWATGKVDMALWDASFLKHYTLVAKQDGEIVGFGDMDGGYLDRLYVHKNYQGQGIATALTDALEQHAITTGQKRIVTHASITARPFFEGRGYCVCQEQQVKKSGVNLTNYIMQKLL